MSNRLRRIVAVMAAALLLSSAFSTSAIADTHMMEPDSVHAPAALDSLVLRPAGLVGLVLGAGLFLAITPIVLITRPHEIGKPFDELVASPARYLWKDPLGGH